ncbi:MAG: hypothetical protein MPJ50_14415 [Pirellulales bacterium]|nr:hypothetical protein [Pirellulales bacterium]
MILLLAVDLSEFAGIIGLVIAFIVWAINQAGAKAKQEEQKKRQAEAAKRQRQRQQAQQARKAQQPQMSQEAEVDAFLRSAAQQRGSSQAPQRQQTSTPLPSAQRSRQTQSTRPPVPHSQPSQSKRPPAQSRLQRTKPPRPGKRTTSPASYSGLQTSDFAASAESMGHLEGHEHDLEQHVHAAFDHDISSLDDRLAARDLDTFGDRSLLDADTNAQKSASPDGAPNEVAPIADSLVEMFRNPANLRNAVIMQEILRRPSA